MIYKKSVWISHFRHFIHLSNFGKFYTYILYQTLIGNYIFCLNRAISLLRTINSFWDIAFLADLAILAKNSHTQSIICLPPGWNMFLIMIFTNPENFILVWEFAGKIPLASPLIQIVGGNYDLVGQISGFRRNW